MRLGKVPERILDRSVLKKIKYKSKDLLSVHAVGKDACEYKIQGDTNLIVTTNPVYGAAEGLGKHAFYRVMNDLACEGGTPAGILLTILLPQGTDESVLREIMTNIGELAQQFQIDILGGHTEVTQIVSKPVITITGIGMADQGMKRKKIVPKAGMDLVMTKWAGAAGGAGLVREGEKSLRERFRPDFLGSVVHYGEQIDCQTEAHIAWRHGACAMHNASGTGLFGALWELGKKCGTGLEIDLKKILIRQETVEICEFYDRNPYEICSDGVLLVVTGDGAGLVNEYDKAGIVAAVIGKLREDRDRVVINGEERRFLVPPENK